MTGRYPPHTPVTRVNRFSGGTLGYAEAVRAAEELERMGRSGLVLLVLGFLLSWLVPVVGVVVMVLGGITTAIVSERSMLAAGERS